VIYGFRDVNTGELLDLEMSYTEVPGIGDTMEWEGRTLKRLPHFPEVRCPAPRHFVDHTLPYNYKYHKATGGQVDEKGRCKFESPRQMRELEAMANEHGEGISYTGGGVKPLVKQKDAGKKTTKKYHGGSV
jgi:hypothetical protein